MAARGGTREGSLDFDVWGCRGSRGLEPGRSRFGTRTACYSLLLDEDLAVFDAGRGLASLASTMERQARFGRVRRVHVLLSHAHMDHWEGLKDADWFWRRDRPLDVLLLGSEEAIRTVERAYAAPSYVPIPQLVEGSPVRFATRTLAAGEELDLGPFRVRAAALLHHSGNGASRRAVDTLGFRVDAPGGASVAYVSDHQPPPDGGGPEEALIAGASLAVADAHFCARTEERHGHGSHEFWASAARRHPGTLVVAGHLGPLLLDAQIRAAALSYGRGLPNYVVAREGDAFRWRRRERRFARKGERR